MKRTFIIQTGIECRATKEGESIEEKLRKILKGNEPIKEITPPIFTAKKDGVLPQYDHRTDRFELAREATDRSHAAYAAASKKWMEAAAKEDINNNKPAGEA